MEPTDEKKPCRHCQLRQAKQKLSDLCRTCFGTTRIRRLYFTYDRRKQRPTHCRHCGGNKPVRPRGLCCRCYDNREIRSQYQPLNNSHQQEPVKDRTGDVPMDSQPCPHHPGSEERIQTLERRAALGVRLFHPGDCVIRKTWRDDRAK